ncbi:MULTISPECIES: phage holin family protein [Spirulina sp. CCY15215]|uniref:phage holin family protein n=1 Tax=Spirulina sp. CCY15215 TaxID=2767591 RepID=UPI0032AF1683
MLNLAPFSVDRRKNKLESRSLIVLNSGKTKIMAMIIGFLVTALVTAVSLLIISRLPLGIEIDSTEKAIWAGVILGLLNGLVKPVLFVLTLPITILTLGIFTLFLNAFIFGITAKLVEGFRLNWGIWSALLGAIALGIINSILNSILLRIFPTFG